MIGASRSFGEDGHAHLKHNGPTVCTTTAWPVISSDTQAVKATSRASAVLPNTSCIECPLSAPGERKGHNKSAGACTPQDAWMKHISTPLANKLRP